MECKTRVCPALDLLERNGGCNAGKACRTHGAQTPGMPNTGIANAECSIDMLECNCGWNAECNKMQDAWNAAWPQSTAAREHACTRTDYISCKYRRRGARQTGQSRRETPAACDSLACQPRACDGLGPGKVCTNNVQRSAQNPTELPQMLLSLFPRRLIVIQIARTKMLLPPLPRMRIKCCCLQLDHADRNSPECFL